MRKLLLSHAKITETIKFKKDICECVKDKTKAGEDSLKSAAGLWSDVKETGVEYEHRLRKDWDKRKQKH